MCPATNKTIRLADCAPDPSYVQIAPGSILHIAQHSAIPFAPPPDWDGQLIVTTRVKVNFIMSYPCPAVMMKLLDACLTLRSK